MYACIVTPGGVPASELIETAMRTITHPGPSRGRVRHIAMVVGGALLLLVALASAAGAAESQDSAVGNRIILSGRVAVAAGETAQDVVVLHGAATTMR